MLQNAVCILRCMLYNGLRRDCNIFLVEILKYSNNVVADDLKLWIGKNCCNGSSSDYWEIVTFVFENW